MNDSGIIAQCIYDIRYELYQPPEAQTNWRLSRIETLFNSVAGYIADLEKKIQERTAQLMQSEADINTERANTERAREAYNSLLYSYNQIKESLRATCHTARSLEIDAVTVTAIETILNYAPSAVEPAKPDGERMKQLQADLSDALRGGPYQVVAALIVEIAREAAKEER